MELPTLCCTNIACGVACIPGDRFCGECGTLLDVPAAQPPGACSCGCTLFDEERFCVDCGARQRVDRGQEDETCVGSGLAAVTDVGLTHIRNDDAFALAGPPGGGPGSIIVICDGVSNSQNPDIASVGAAKAARDRMAAAWAAGENISEAIKDAIRLAHASTCTVPFDRNADVDPPAATIVVAVVSAGAPGRAIVTVGWLGDSRLYWISRSGSGLLTRDHSWMNQIIDSGKMSEEEARRDRRAHAITKCLGTEDMDHVTPCQEPSISEHDLVAEGYLLACTDGLWNYAETASAIAIAANGTLTGNPAVAPCRKLVAYAKSRGGHDNITVAITSLRAECG